MTDREHVPCRPGWDCWSCDRPWPCDPAREDLALQLDPVELAKFMGERLAEAARDVPTLQPGELFERFLQWTWKVRRQ
ncbi:hypothetical protein [Actinoplanes sp. NPDC049316]|uniref:hypothetical protein n=1 Tax=Actinoplanes sp. NPDC049316 TaxID=3154727 RepID=UPI003430BD52